MIAGYKPKNIKNNRECWLHSPVENKLYRSLLSCLIIAQLTIKKNIAQDNTGGGLLPVRGGGTRLVPARASLSKAHIRPEYKSEPKIEVIRGASLFRSTKDKKFTQVGGGKRGAVKGFSRQSRARLMETIAKVKTAAELPDFVTLTYPDNFPDVARSKRDIRVFQKRLVRRFPDCGYIWKLEPQERGAPHFHLLVWGCQTRDLFHWTVDAWYQIAGQGDINHYLFHLGALKDSKPCVSKVTSWRGVWSYASKYLGKTFEVAEWGSKWTGRFWGVGNSKNIPFGETEIIRLSERYITQIMRLQRRYMNMRKRGNLPSLKTFCNVDHWIEKISEWDTLGWMERKSNLDPPSDP